MTDDFSNEGYAAVHMAFLKASVELYHSIDDVIQQDAIVLNDSDKDLLKAQGLLEVTMALRDHRVYASELVDPKQIAEMALENCNAPYCDTVRSPFPHNQRFVDAAAEFYAVSHKIIKFPQHKNLDPEGFY